MLRRTVARGLLALIAAVGVRVPAAAVATELALPASANESAPKCRTNEATGVCELTATDKKDWTPPSKGKPASTTRVATKPSCRSKGQEIPCSTAEGFWDRSTGCYLKRVPEPHTLADVSKLPKNAVFYRCWWVFGVVEHKPQDLERFETVMRTYGKVIPIDPREAARQVVEAMPFAAPRIGLSAHLRGETASAIVNAPVWMWVADPGPTTTGPQTRTAAVGGVSITAVATLDRVDWSMGDGAVVGCDGPGTVFDPALAEGKALHEVPDSPTCGHRYEKASRCEDGASFPVTAAAVWNVHWTGGGTEGDIPLEFRRSTKLSVIELRPVLVDPDDGEPSGTSQVDDDCAR